MADARIRPYESRDAEAAASLLRSVFPPPAAVSAAAVEHWITGAPARARIAAWVAYDGGELIGWADAELRWSVAEDGITELWVAVAPARRGEGLGRELYALAERHVMTLDPRRIDSFVREDEPASVAFAERRGFREARREYTWALDLRKAAARAPAPRDDARVVRLSEVRNRVQELFTLYDEAHSDMPGDHTHALRFDEWVRETYENPELDFETSAVVLAGERPVALAWLTTDRETRRSSHELTGTLREFRGRGLARLAKEAAIHWSAAAGIEYLITSNDDANSPMLGLNERLGYERRTTLIELAKDV